MTNERTEARRPSRIPLFAQLLVLGLGPMPIDGLAQVLADPKTHRVVALEEADLCDRGEWHLVFEDEFNGVELDTLSWLRFYPYCNNYDDCLGSRTHGLPDELQIFRDENVVMTGNGTVQLIIKRGQVSSWFSFSSVYTSGLLHSRMPFPKGRFECRCRIPKSTSRYITSAFWLFGGGSSCSEIDIMEQLWKAPEDLHCATHRYNETCNGNHASTEDRFHLPWLSDDFHTYRADWDTWFVDFYLDDTRVARVCRLYDMLARPVSSCRVPTGIYLQNQAFPMQDHELSVIIGPGLHDGPFVDELGHGPSIPDLPAVMEVDYVRVYQRDP